MKKKVALFPGSFDPFTLGHKSLVDRALNLFDEIIIAVGVNENKHYILSEQKRVDFINQIFHNNNRVKAVSYSGLTVDFAARLGIDTILRGVRNINDFEYEKNLADINREIGSIETLFLVSLPQYAFISSSMIRELLNNGYDIDKFLPSHLEI